MRALQRLHEFRLAIMMLTRLPMGQLPEPVPALGAAAWAFPLVGLVTGTVGWMVLELALLLGVSSIIAALLALGAGIWFTGALHEDGLADFADGMGGGRDRAHCLEIMRDSRIGSYGVTALILAIALKATALAEVSIGPVFAALVFVGVVSRLMMLAPLIWMPPARDEGLGHTAHGPKPRALAPGLATAGIIALWLGPQAVGLLTVMGLGAAFLAALTIRRIQGQTGDVLGATQSVSETFGLVAASTLLT